MMTDSKPKITVASEEDVRRYAGAPDPSPNDAPPVDAAAPGDEPSPDRQIEQLRQELASLNDKYLRAKAETVNVSRRLNEERAEAVRLAHASFVRDLLKVVDDLERTRTFLKDRSDDDALATGVRMIYDDLMKVLRDHGVEPMESVGRPFDPTRHEALMQQDSTEHPPGTVVAELSRGYMIRDRVLRAARVAVARTPEAKAAADSEPAPS
ncbi:MAG: nucleotide exchange factor GrpE [Phycisphaerae bacterium]|nr:nucleotide exchange factor GrpE [Phycisphaerae bacterium]